MSAQITVDSTVHDSIKYYIMDNEQSLQYFSSGIIYNSHKITREQMDQLPVRDFNDLIRLHPSLIIQDGNIHIRGGRADENGYLIDGAWASNPMDNSNGIYIIPEMIDQIAILPGTYSAQYGGANSGLIMTTLKTGSDDYRFNINFQTDKFASKGEKFLDTYSYRDHSFVVTAGGPLINANNLFFLAIENESIGDTQKRFSEGFEFDNMVDTSPYNPDVQNGNSDTLNIKYPDGFTPFNSLDRWAFDGTLVFDLDPVQISLSGILNYTETKQNDHPMLDVFNDRQYFYNNNQYLLTGKLSHKINPDFNYEIQLSRFSNKKEKEDPYMGTDWTTWADSAAVYRKTNGKIIYRNHWRSQYDYFINGFYFNRSSTYQEYIKNEQTYNAAAFKLTYNYNENFSLLFGGDYKRYTIRNFWIFPSIMEEADFYGSLYTIPEDNRALYLGNTYGYEFAGYASEKAGIDGPKHPEIASLYIENISNHDKVNLNLGFRLDYLDTKHRKIRDPQNIRYSEDNLVVKKSKMFVNPRLNLSVDLNDNFELGISYSQNVQPAKFDMLYWNYNTFLSMHGDGFFYIVPIGLNIDPIKTKVMEIILSKSISNNIDFKLVGFCKKSNNQLRPKRTNPEGSVSEFNYISNGARSDIKGFEISMKTNLNNNIVLGIDYAYTDAKGNGSYETSFLNIVDLNEVNYPDILYPLDFEHKHNLNLNLDYQYGNEKRNNYLRNSGLNLLFEITDGHPYTYSEGSIGSSYPYDMGVNYMLDTRWKRALELPNSSRTKWNHTLNLKVYKEFKLYDQLSINIYCRVLNLLNTKNEINVYEKTGRPDNDGFNSDLIRNTYIQTYGKEYEDLNKAINLENGQSYWDVLGKQLYSHPRQILFGMQINY